MPLTFPSRPAGDTPMYSAASIREILIDIMSKRVLITIEYGDIVNNVFVRNKNISTKVHVLDNDKWVTLAVAKPNSLLGLYDNIKQFAWQALINAGFESGTIS